MQGIALGVICIIELCMHMHALQCAYREDGQAVTKRQEAKTCAA